MPLSMLHVNGHTTSHFPTIRQHVMGFYQQLFSNLDMGSNIDFSVVYDVVPRMVIDLENSYFISVPTSF